MLPVFIEAEYEDGFVHREDEEDRSLFEPEKRNVFFDIVNRLPDIEHGPMVRFSLINLTMSERTDVDFTILPSNARPIYFKHREADFDVKTGAIVNQRLMGVDFGYQFTNEDGQNQQEVIQIRLDYGMSLN